MFNHSKPQSEPSRLSAQATTAPEDQEPFDAELVLTIDGELDSQNSRLPILTTVVTADGKEKAQFGEHLLEFLALINEIQTLQKVIARLLAQGKDVDKKQLQKKEAILYNKAAHANALLGYFYEEKLIRRQMLQVLVEGRVKVGIWLDSIGGEVRLADKVTYTKNFLTQQGALVHSYILVKASSAAFDLAFLADQIHSLNRSVLMWHLSESPQLSRAESVERVKQQEQLPEILDEELEAFMAVLQRAHPDSSEEIMGAFLHQFYNPNNPQGNVYFEGSYAAQVGLISEAHRNIESLIQRFKLDFPLHSDTNLVCFTDGIARKVNEIVKQIPNWVNPRATGATDRLLRRYEKRGARRSHSK